MTGPPMAVHSVNERLTSIAPMAAAPVWHARIAAALSEESTRRFLENLGVAILRRTLFTKMKKHGFSIEGA